MLCGLAHMCQASFLNCVFLDPSPFLDDGLVAAEVDIGGREVAEALVVSVMVVMGDESLDLVLQPDKPWPGRRSARKPHPDRG